MGYILGIVIAALAAGLIREHLRIKALNTSASPESQARIEALEARVRTLEKIVTDEGYDLRREFNKL